MGFPAVVPVAREALEALRPFDDGAPVLVRTVRSLLRCEFVDRVFIVSERAIPSMAGVFVVPGTRLDEVVDPAADVVLVQDPLQPEFDPAVLRSVVAAVRAGAGAASALSSISDTVKRVDAHGRIVSTVDRERLRVALMPQAVARRLVPRLGQDGDIWALGEPVTTV